jgi:electron transport complex protein RnfG
MQLFPALRTSTLAISFFAVVCAAVIAITQVSTQSRIVDNEREYQARALYEIVSRDTIDNDLLEDTFEIKVPELGHEQLVSGYRARLEGKVTTVILPVTAPDGYSGNISLIVGINRDGTLAGVRVLSHKETPGLGDKVETKKSDWILSFAGKQKTGSDDSNWAVKKDGGQFDQFTGATITPRAVVNAVGRALDFFAANRTFLLETTAEDSTQTVEVTE